MTIRPPKQSEKNKVFSNRPATLTEHHKNATMGSPTVNDLFIHEFFTVGSFSRAFL